MAADDEKLRAAALQWVKDNKNIVFEEILAGRDFSQLTAAPAASFMAGTPGAGKTEVSKRFLEQFALKLQPLRIDADDFREKIPGYNGNNSAIIQPAAALAVDKILQKAFDKKYPFLLDGTFAFGRALQNLKRADRRDYSLQVFYVYQDPLRAWEFTKKRERKEGRNVPKETFINAYFESRANVDRAKEFFGDKLNVVLIVKDYELGTEELYDNVQKIEDHLEKVYNKDELDRRLVS